jgi:hypothetical protein
VPALAWRRACKAGDGLLKDVMRLVGGWTRLIGGWRLAAAAGGCGWTGGGTFCCCLIFVDCFSWLLCRRLLVFALSSLCRFYKKAFWASGTSSKDFYVILKFSQRIGHLLNSPAAMTLSASYNSLTKFFSTYPFYQLKSLIMLSWLLGIPHFTCNSQFSLFYGASKLA